MGENQRTRSSVICGGHRYRNAPEMIEWLCHVFGFERHAVYAGPNGTIAHAALTLGSGMILVASYSDSESQRLLRQPDEIGGAETRHVYLVVPNADEVYRRAKLSGAEIVLEIKDQSYGGRGFTCRDPEGHIWNVGTYDPWEGK
jgi:uncharacterized glyoxalase superfamily protein PhnB